MRGKLAIFKNVFICGYFSSRLKIMFRSVCKLCSMPSICSMPTQLYFYTVHLHWGVCAVFPHSSSLSAGILWPPVVWQRSSTAPCHLGGQKQSSRYNIISGNLPLIYTAPDKVHIFISIMAISSLNSMLDHLLESSHRDDSNKWSNIGFSEEIR